MEPNTTSSPAASWTSHASALEHGEPTVLDASLLTPAFSPAPPSPGLLVVPASGSGSESSSWYQQIPPSPAVAVGNGSLAVHAHATSSPSQSVPSPSFLTAGTLPMMGDDLFGSPEATAATPLPTFSGGQWQHGESSSSWAAAPVLPECPSPGSFAFAGESAAAWASEDTSSFFSPSSAGVLSPQTQSSDNFLVGFAPPSSEDSDELEALLQSFRIPSVPVEDESPVVDAQMLPVEEDEQGEEETDASVFLVSDPENQLPNAWWTASPQTAGGGGEGSASWMAPGNTGNNSPPMMAPAAASTCTMVSTSSGSMACHSGGWSKGVASSIVMKPSSSSVLPLVPPSPPQGAGNNWPPMLAADVGAMMKPSSSSVPPLVPPSSQGGAGVSSSSFNGFAPQPSSSFVLAPHAPNQQGPPLLPVKQEVMEYVDVDAMARRHPDFISLVDDDEDGLDQDAMFGSWGSGSSWPGSSGGSRPSFAPGSWGGGGGSGSGSGSGHSFAPGNWGSSGVSPGVAPGSWGGGGGSSSRSPSFASGSWGDGRGSSSSPSFAPNSWGGGGGGGSSPSSDGSMPCFDQSMSIDNDYGPCSMQIRGRMASLSGLPPLPKSDVRASTFESCNGGTGIIFTHLEMEIIAKEKKLQELVKTDPKKVKRMLYNRAYSATAKVRRVMHTKNLERMIVELEERRNSLCAELQSLQEGSATLKAQQMEMQMSIGELEQQTMIKDVVREGLRADIQNLKHQRLN